jgi:hypothetical protein
MPPARFRQQRLAESTGAKLRGSDHASNGRRVKLYPRIDETTVCREIAFAILLMPPDQMPRRNINAIKVLEGAVLLNDKHLNTRRRDGVPIAQ